MAQWTVLTVRSRMRRSQLSPLPTRVTGTSRDRVTPRSGPLRTISSPASGFEPGDRLDIRSGQYRRAGFLDARKSAGDREIQMQRRAERREPSDPVMIGRLTPLRLAARPYPDT